jgi:peptidoglycan/xylan/chitin deacetylase (PgdA/CDA1 family)
MTAEELRRLAGNRWVTIGAHTVSHASLAALSEQEQLEEIFSSKQQLEMILGREINVFSYPFGTRKDFDRTSVRLAREAGFVRAAANFPGQAHRWTDAYQIPRQLVRNWDENTFAQNLQRFRVL